MKNLAASALALSLIAFETQAQETPMLTVTPNGSQPSMKGPADYFTGTVRVDAPFKGTEPAQVSGATVTFEPGARTAWHSHPLGQTLIVTAGSGWVQQAGQPVQSIKPGDTVWIPPQVRHWHGATSTTSMTHIAIAEVQDGKVVDWMDQVSADEYPDGLGLHSPGGSINAGQ
ncbi:cupin domain-containing protein [Pseudomonas sp. MWU12-2312b]|uniref:(R)-mandelonitrile lyase n=1 Tax=Pseudomonas moorei TaxID=395599 RepID=UPI000D49A7BD|nr:cupin domain-containing protein [Pseudomonas moorei]POZ99579.1 cupin domain-containing protein [Pseudomonas sp. MWU12-2312b]